MKNLKIIFYLVQNGIFLLGTLGLILTANVSNAQEGTVNGGGGVGVRCNGKLELLDLYEARNSNIQLISNPRSDESALNLLSKKFGEHFWNPETIAPVQQQNLLKVNYFEPLYRGTGHISISLSDYPDLKDVEIIDVEDLALSADIGPIYLKPGCHLEQIAYFSERNRQMKIVRNRFKELNRLGKMGLATHELSFLIYRLSPMNVSNPTYGLQRETTSLEARQFTGLILSKEGLPAKSKHIPIQTIPTRCISHDITGKLVNAFYIFKLKGEQKYMLSFKLLFDYWTPYLTYVEVPFDIEKHFLQNDQASFQFEASLTLESRERLNMGLFLEIRKEAGTNIGMRILDSNRRPLQNDFSMVSCESSRSIK